MSVRKLLLFLGVAFVIAGLWLAALWLNRVTTPVAQAPRQDRPALLTALHALPSGTLLRAGDIGWKDIAPGEMRPGQLMRGTTSEAEFLGAITRRDFTEGEPLIGSELVKPGDRRFLTAVLRVGHRAVSISVDAPQTASGLVLPGDYVDVILTQSFGDNIASIAQRSVGETVLRNVRVVAVDQSLGAQPKPGGPAAAAGPEARVPKTVTLEVEEGRTETLLVATQLGKLQLAVRALEGSGAARTDEGHLVVPTWAWNVSPAILAIASIETEKLRAEKQKAESVELRAERQRDREQKDRERREAAQLDREQREQKDRERREAAQRDREQRAENREQRAESRATESSETVGTKISSKSLLPVSSGSTLEHAIRYPPPYAPSVSGNIRTSPSQAPPAGAP